MKWLKSLIERFAEWLASLEEPEVVEVKKPAPRRKPAAKPAVKKAETKAEAIKKPAAKKPAAKKTAKPTKETKK